MVVTPALGEEAFQAGAGGCSLQAVLSSLVSSVPSVDDLLLASNSFHCISQLKSMLSLCPDWTPENAHVLQASTSLPWKGEF